MLVLTRKSNQSIMIGDDIEVSVLSVMGDKVRIGIQAPRDIPVFRTEVYLEIKEETGEAPGSAADVQEDGPSKEETGEAPGSAADVREDGPSEPAADDPTGSGVSP